MNTPIERRIEALESAVTEKRRVGLICTLEGETVEQALARMGVSADDGVFRIVLVPMKARQPTDTD